MRTCENRDVALPGRNGGRLTLLVRLTTVNAIQLAVALVANLILLLNMAKKMRFTIAQPITIVTWYISSFCLVALTAAAGESLKGTPGDNYIWSAAFYYGAYAACLYFFCSSLMVVTFWGAMKGKYSKDFQLTTSQRTLMLQTIMFLVYLLLGALVFSTTESWAYLDAVYWADVTLFTVGFGDFYPESTLGRALLFPYALIGVISLGLVVGSIRSLVLERGRRQLAARMVEKKRKRILRRMVKRGKDDILIPVIDDDNDEGGMEWSDQRLSSTGLTEFQRRQREFGLMRKIQAKAEQRRRWMAMGVSTTVWLILWLVGAAIFQQCEVTYQGWTYFDGFYFAFVSLTTIGYGDVTPISPAGKSFFVFWSLLALPTMTVLISNAGDTVVKLIREWTDWLGVVTILPGERGFKREIKLFVKAISLGKIFNEDTKESPPGILGDAEPRYSSSDSDSNDERQIAKDNGGQLRKSTDGLEKEIRNVTGNQQMEHNEKGLVGDVTKNGDTQYEPGEEDLLTKSTTTPSITLSRPPTSPRPAGNGAGHLSFAEPPERPDSSRKTCSSSLPSPKRAGDGSSSTSSKKKRRGHSNNGISAQTVGMTRTASMARTSAQLPMAVPEDPHDYMVVLIDEISLVTQHMKSHPPRKYSFEEWAWYLRLIGEDEGSAETHTKPVPRSRRKNKKNKTGSGAEGKSQGDHPEKLQWSWVGSRSPLMGSQEEAEWILEKLQQRLAEELRATRDEALGRDSSG